MIESASGLGTILVNASVAGLVVAGLALFAMLTTRQPSRRRAIGRAGLMGLLLVVPLVRWRVIAPVEVGPILLDVVGPALDLRGGPLGRLLQAIGRPIVATGLVSLYAAGLALGVARLGLGWVGIRRIVAASEPPRPETAALYQAIPTGHRRPELRVSTRIGRPVLLGLVRPVLLIPAGLDDPSQAGGLRLALLHELAHAESGDLIFGMLGELASAAWFWLPPVWWIRTQVRLDGEFLADHGAAEAFGRPEGYATTLVDLAASRTDPSVRPGGRAGSSALTDRVLMLIRSPFAVERRPPRWWTRGLIVATFALVLVSTASEIEARPARPDRVEPRSLSLADLSIVTPDEPRPSIELPIRLRPSFLLDFELIASDDELTRIEILGHPLLDRPRSVGEPRLRTCRLSREAGAVLVSIDGSPPLGLERVSAEDFLRISTSGSMRVRLQNVRLIW